MPIQLHFSDQRLKLRRGVGKRPKISRAEISGDGTHILFPRARMSGIHLEAICASFCCLLSCC